MQRTTAGTVRLRAVVGASLGARPWAVVVGASVRCVCNLSDKARYVLKEAVRRGERQTPPPEAESEA